PLRSENACQLDIERLCNLPYLWHLGRKCRSAADQCGQGANDVNVGQLIECKGVIIAPILLDTPDVFLRIRSIKQVTKSGRAAEVRGQIVVGCGGSLRVIGRTSGAAVIFGGNSWGGRQGYGNSGSGSNQGSTNSTHGFTLSVVGRDTHCT